jgi:hypothetical protein
VTRHSGHYAALGLVPVHPGADRKLGDPVLERGNTAQILAHVLFADIPHGNGVQRSAAEDFIAGCYQPGSGRRFVFNASRASATVSGGIS